MIERESGNIDFSELSPDKKLSHEERLKNHIDKISYEIGLDSRAQESLRRFTNIYFRLHQVSQDFAGVKPLFKGYVVKHENGQTPEYFWLKRELSDDFISNLSNCAFDAYNAFLEEHEDARIAAYRVREFVHGLFK